MSRKSWPRVVVIGDSLTQGGFGNGGWVAQLADKLQRQCDVLNRGFNGYTTHTLGQLWDDAINRSDLLSEDTVAATLFLGANDANLLEQNPVQHVPLETYKANLRKMILSLCDGHLSKDRLIVIPSPPSDPPAWKQFLENRDGAKLDKAPKCKETDRLYYEASRSVARELGCDTLDFWSDLDSPEMFVDGLHLSAKGNEVLFRHLWPLVEARTKHLPWMFPQWGDLGGCN